MVQLEGIRSKSTKALCGVLTAASLLTGCSYTTLDTIRPEVNKANGLVVIPSSVLSSTESLQADDGVVVRNDGNIINVPTTPPSSGMTDEEDVVFGSLPAQGLSASSYKDYLRDHVVSKISACISACPDIDKRDIYFRVLHTGYDPVGTESSSTIKPAASYVYQDVGSVSAIGGTLISEFAMDYFSSLPVNDGRIASERERAISYLRSVEGGSSLNWENSKGVVKDVYRIMWGNKRLRAEESLNSYISCVERSAIGTIPNLSMKVRTNDYGGTTTAVLNDVNYLMTRYEDKVSKLALSKMFTEFNQYEDRIATRTFHVNDDDENCMLFAYVDGYTKTLIVIGCESGKKLSDILGYTSGIGTPTVYQEVLDIMRGVKPYTEWTYIMALDGMEDAITIAGGARGVS